MARLERLWLAGSAGQPPGIRRKIALTNQVGLFGAAATVPYQLFYTLYDFSVYGGVFFANLVFVAGYFAGMLLNCWGRHTAARNLVLVNACTQLIVVTYFLSAGAGVHLFYFTIASIMAFIFRPLKTGRFCLQMSVLALLFLLGHFAFRPGQSAIAVPSPFLDIMFAGSVIGVLALISVFTFLLRRDFDAAEDDMRLRNESLQALSATDQLTGLANRRQLDETLLREWARARREQTALTVMMCDVDYFKRFNDALGHQAGDECLRRVAAALTHSLVRPSDLVARFGGEEFALVLAGTDAGGAGRVAERIRAAVESLAIAHPDSPTAATVTLSVGVTTADPLPGTDPDALLWRADEALYQAKAEGRNRVCQLPFRDAVLSSEVLSGHG